MAAESLPMKWYFMSHIYKIDSDGILSVFVIDILEMLAHLVFLSNKCFNCGALKQDPVFLSGTFFSLNISSFF